MKRVVAVVAVVLCWTCAAPAFAASEDGARPARELDPNTVLFARVLLVAVGGLLVWIATGIARNGLGIGAGLRRVTGPVAWTVAGALGTLGIVVAILGIGYVRVLLGVLFGWL